MELRTPKGWKTCGRLVNICMGFSSYEMGAYGELHKFENDIRGLGTGRGGLTGNKTR